MSQLVCSHVADDAHLAQEVADALTVAGYPTELAQAPSAGGEAAATIAIVSGTALLDNDFDEAVTAARKTGRPWLPLLSGLSAWEFSMRRPAWTRDQRAFTPPELVAGGAERAVAALVARLTELGVPAGPPGTVAPRPRPAATPSLADQPPPSWLSASTPLPAAVTEASIETPSIATPSLADLTPAPVRETAPVAPPTTPIAPAEGDRPEGGERRVPEVVEPPPAEVPVAKPVTVSLPPPPDPDDAPVAVIGTGAPAAPRPRRRYEPATPPGPIKATVKPTVRPLATTPQRRGSARGCLIALALVFGLPILGFLLLGSLIFVLAGESPATTVATARPATTVAAEATPINMATAVSVLTTRASTAAPPTPRATSAPPTRLPTGAPSVAPTPPSAQIIDTFDNTETGLLPRVSPSPELYRLGVDRGEFVIATLDPEWARIPTVRVEERYQNATLAVDARLVGATTGRAISLACRDQGSESGSQYRFTINPARNQIKLARFDSGAETSLVNWRTASALRGGTQTNRLELRCLNDSIVALVNGQVVANVRDTTYREGQFWLSAGTFADTKATAEARFDNLVISVPIQG